MRGKGEVALGGVGANGSCQCSTGEAMRNVLVQIVEHSNTCNDSEPARHLRENPLLSFSWPNLFTSEKS